jgi:hypothetical protein
VAKAYPVILIKELKKEVLVLFINKGAEKRRSLAKKASRKKR